MYTFIEAAENLNQAICEFGLDVSECCEAIQKIMTLLGSVPDAKPEEPNSKIDLEIFSQIEPYDECN